MNIRIRKMQLSDIDYKIGWINDPKVNEFLHYDLPITKDRTIEWFNRIKNKSNRYDGIIEYNGIPAGIIGLLNIDGDSAEYYITLGIDYSGKGIAKNASNLLLKKAFLDFNLKKIILYTEVDNIKAQNLFERLLFRKVGVEKEKVFNQRKGKYVDRFIYVLTRQEFFHNYLNFEFTPINYLYSKSNNLFIKRDDFIPFSFGGNKARKAKLFFNEIMNKKCNYIVTYGSSSSNHCRIIANKASSLGIPCLIISPEENHHETNNSKLMKLFGANIAKVKVSEVKETIEKTMNKLKQLGYNAYFIQGGGHGNIGTQAYVDAYEEIRTFEKEKDIYFDYIFHASGTGTTQAGLICGQLLNKDSRKIIGISIARRNPYGRNVVIESIKDYFKEKEISISENVIELHTHFIDQYISEGYGIANQEMKDLIKDMMKEYGLPLDYTYTGKAFYGMVDYLKKQNIQNKNILFIHTGGTPLYFDDMEVW